MEQQVDKEICLMCGAILKNAVETTRILGLPIPTKRDRCEYCCYLENFRKQSLCAKPFKTIMPRPMRNGQVPREIHEEIARYREECAGKTPLF